MFSLLFCYVQQYTVSEVNNESEKFEMKMTN